MSRKWAQPFLRSGIVSVWCKVLGKTVTCSSIVGLHSELGREDLRALVAAQTNAAVDTVALRMRVLGLPIGRYGHLNSMDAAFRLLLRFVVAEGLALVLVNSTRPHLSVRGKAWEKVFKAALAQHWALYSVRFGTLASIPLSSSVNGEIYALVLVDEAATSTEPATLHAVNIVDPEHGCLVLCGDHMQLPLVLNNPLPAARGLGRSLFERL